MRARNADLLLLDEASSALDARAQRELYADLVRQGVLYLTPSRFDRIDAVSRAPDGTRKMTVICMCGLPHLVVILTLSRHYSSSLNGTPREEGRDV